MSSGTPVRARVRLVLFCTTPPLAALLLYWPGLTCWFQKDDFAWLGLRGMVHNGRDLLWALFAPLAQGTIRTLSERVVYLSLYSLFGLNALPYRLLAFITFAAALTLLSVVGARLTGSRAAGFCAALFWLMNSCLAVAMSWTAIYYELLCSLSLLLSLWLLIRYNETGQQRYFVAQVVSFVCGFGMLELNVVYPALASAYALCHSPRLLKKLAPLWILSAAYTALHMLVAPLEVSGPYKMFWNASVFSTLWIYWKMALGPNRLIYLSVYPSRWRSLMTIALMAALFAFLVCKIRRREWIVLFPPAWFLIVLAPLLPLRDHISDYYLTIPLIGFAMWAGWALASAWHAGWLWRPAAIALALIYAGVSIPIARVTTQSFYDRSLQIKHLVYGIADLHRNHPNATVFLTGVDREMFQSAFLHRPLRLLGITDVYLLDTPANRAATAGTAVDVGNFFTNAQSSELSNAAAVIYDVSSGAVREIPIDQAKLK